MLRMKGHLAAVVVAFSMKTSLWVLVRRQADRQKASACRPIEDAFVRDGKAADSVASPAIQFHEPPPPTGARVNADQYSKGPCSICLLNHPV